MAGIEVSKGSMPSMHNTREGDMSTEELNQCLLDIKTWLLDHVKAVKLADPASEADIAALRSKLGQDNIPAVVEQLLRAYNGGLPLFDSSTLSASDVMAATDVIRGSPKGRGDLLPLAKNGDGAYLVTDAAGKLFSWDSEDGLGAGEGTLSSYLEKYRNSMLAGKVVTLPTRRKSDQIDLMCTSKRP